MKRYLSFLLAALALFAQVTPLEVTLMDYSGSDLIYIGKAVTPTVYTHSYIAAGCTGAAAHCSALTSVVDSSNTATITAPLHGLAVGNEVCITGAADADLNVCMYIQTVTDENIFTVTTASVTDNSYASGLTMTTRAPRNTDPIWKITKCSYSSGLLVRVQTSTPTSVWANRAVTTGSTKTFYR